MCSDMVGDPCFDVKKVLAVGLGGCGVATELFRYTVTVPVGSKAKVLPRAAYLSYHLKGLPANNGRNAGQRC